jgi:hypothetical protein
MEQNVVSELANLCISPGYAHVVAHFCFRDNVISYSQELTAKDLQRISSEKRLSRSEISTIIGLMIKARIDYALPDLQTFQEYVDRTETLLDELHQTHKLAWRKVDGKSLDPYKSAAAMREPIFYAGDSAYSFQY